jgi:alpha,alpha-trehalose phosphorylase
MSRYVIHERFDEGLEALRESLFMVGNGHIGIRGSEEERRHAAFQGTLVNGFFEKRPISYGEWAYGYAKDHETILNVADIASIELEVDGSPMDFRDGRLESYRRRLDLEGGRLEREVAWTAPSGAGVLVRSSRLASFERSEIAAMRYEVAARSACRIALASLVDASVRNRASEAGDPRVGAHLDPNPLDWEFPESSKVTMLATGRTARSRLGIAVAAAHSARHALEAGEARPEIARIGEELSARWELALAAGTSFRVDKFVALVDGRAEELRSLAARAEEAVRAAVSDGYEVLEREQEARVSRFWTGAAISVDGDPEVEEGLRFNIFHLLQSAGRDGRTSLAAKGLSGEGYEGHYFWDTEIYALPFFTYEAPEIARSLVKYRIGMLDKARARARELSLPGALFPWRTIDGEETSAYYPAGTAQFHIDADIAYALSRYAAASGDGEILAEGGAELLFETARLWMALGFFNPRKGGRFCIPCVTGPDEYSALADNNAYTNLMAEHNLRLAAEAADALERDRPEAYRGIAQRISLGSEERSSWLRAADRMYLPSDPATGILPQDDQFLDRLPWDLAATPREDFPLLLHYHPLMIYRARTLKQPDAVLALFLRHERFSLAEKMRNFRFYEPLTTGDSSLSHCIQSVMAAECGLVEKAYDYFLKTVRMDLDDVHGNSRDGVHIAAMAGSWISAVYGFAGMREGREHLSFRPELPAKWDRLAFTLAYRGRKLACECRRDATAYELLDGEKLEIEHEGKRYLLARGRRLEIDERPRPRCWIFDLDGVIADTACLHERAWRRMAAELGLPFGPEQKARIRGVSRMESLKLVLGESVALYDEAGLEELARRKNDYYREALAGLAPADVLPGMRALLESLKESGVSIALASASRNSGEVLMRLGIAGLFDAIVDPGSLAMPKPDPEIFLKAAGLLSARIKDCVAFEDAQAGIDAIRAAGIFAVGIGADLECADLRFERTDSVDRALVEAAFEARGERRDSRTS